MGVRMVMRMFVIMIVWLERTMQRRDRKYKKRFIEIYNREEGWWVLIVIILINCRLLVSLQIIKVSIHRSLRINTNVTQALAMLNIRVDNSNNVNRFLKILLKVAAEIHYSIVLLGFVASLKEKLLSTPWITPSITTITAATLAIANPVSNHLFVMS